MPQTVTVTANDDADATSETLTIGHLATGGDYEGLAVDPVTVTVADDEMPGVTVTAPKPFTVAEGMEATYTVALESAPLGTVHIDLEASDGSAVSVTPKTLRFMAVDYNTAQTVTVRALNDADTDGETVTIRHRVSSADYGAERVMAEEVTVTVTDTGEAALVLSPRALSLDEGGEATTYTVRLATEPSAAVTVTVTSALQSKVTVEPATLTFPAGDWDEPQPVTVRPVDDDDYPATRR